VEVDRIGVTAEGSGIALAEVRENNQRNVEYQHKNSFAKESNFYV
jgi:hypothetical protein